MKIDGILFSSGYWREGFLTLQKAVDAAIVTVVEDGLDSANWTISHCHLSEIEKITLLKYLFCKKHKNIPKINCTRTDLEFASSVSHECKEWLVKDVYGSSVSLQRFPFPPFLENAYIAAIQQNMPMLVMLSYVISALYIIRYVTIEKEKRLKVNINLFIMGSLINKSESKCFLLGIYACDGSE